MSNLRGIVKKWLTDNGYDGLCDAECGCRKNDLFPCGYDPGLCIPGKIEWFKDDMEVKVKPTPITLDDAQRAADEWGANCGPGAIAAVLGLTLDEVRPHMQDFERKRYSNPKLVFTALQSLGVEYRKSASVWPVRGLVRVQWEGPWTVPGVPRRVRYRHTHWIGARRVGENVWNTEIFDINCICAGGWVPLVLWTGQVVPWLLRECEPKAFGTWHQTHVLELV